MCPPLQDHAETQELILVSETAQNRNRILHQLVQGAGHQQMYLLSLFLSLVPVSVCWCFHHEWRGGARLEASVQPGPERTNLHARSTGWSGLAGGPAEHATAAACVPTWFGAQGRQSHAGLFWEAVAPSCFPDTSYQLLLQTAGLCNTFRKRTQNESSDPCYSLFNISINYLNNRLAINLFFPSDALSPDKVWPSKLCREPLAPRCCTISKSIS